VRRWTSWRAAQHETDDVALSNRKVDALGERLRDSPTPAPEDLELLSEVLIEHNAALQEVSERLSSLGYPATTRLKTSGTLIEKLRRESHLTLKSIRDVAGARIVRPMTLDEQDEVARRILELWPGARLIDRRERPSHGYRAIHIVPTIGRCPVEIQLRTLYQDTWAQIMESFGDRWGRAIRYGGEPDDPDGAVEGVDVTRADFVRMWKETADALYTLAQVENRIARIKAGTAVDESASAEGLQETVDSQFGLLRDLVRDIARALEGQRGG